MESIPAFVNAGAGSAQGVLDALNADPRCDVRSVPADALGDALRQLGREGAATVLVAGGDGTLATAAAALAGHRTTLGVIPAGTLNHFAQDYGLPLDPAEAVQVALNGATASVDLGSVNGRYFLNTSAVGAYVVYVRIRERWERYLGYLGASVLAAVVSFVRLRGFSVALEVDGQVRHFRSPLVFIGVGERDLRPPKLGGRKEDGRRGLHVLIVRDTSRPRLIRMALRTLVRGIRPWAGKQEVESLLVQRCTISLPRPSGRVAVDGEIIRCHGPLEYACETDALTLRVPAPAPPAP